MIKYMEATLNINISWFNLLYTKNYEQFHIRPIHHLQQLFNTVAR